MGMAEILAMISIIISVTGFFLNLYLNNRFYGPECRVIVNSIPKGFKIQFENVGDRIMHIEEITYSINQNEKKEMIYTDNLSAIFYDIPCETRAEVRLKDVNLFSNSKHNLITTTFLNQDDLMKAWEIVGKMNVRVVYRGALKFKHYTSIIKLEDYYITFNSAISDGKGQVRELIAFQEQNNIKN